MNCFRLSTQIFLPVLFVVIAAGFSHRKNVQSTFVNKTGYLNKVQQIPAIKIHSNALGSEAPKISLGRSSFALNANANFGSSVSSAGDVNGDGYSDVIVGAPNFSGAFSGEGAAYLYMGSPTGLNLSSANWNATGGMVGSKFGSSVATAGDVNGDGFSDVLVGAPNYANGEVAEGKAYLYYGSATGLSATPAWSFEPNFSNINLGICVRSAGDINGDGFSDVLIGSSGYVLVFLGSPSGLGINQIQYLSNPSLPGFGTVISSAGDINKDGFFDLLVGVPNANTPGGISGGGIANIYLGTSSGTFTTTPTWTASGNATNEHFGASVSFGGDINGNAYSDIIIGSPNQSTAPLSDQGQVTVFLNASGTINANPGFVFKGTQNGQEFGAQVLCGGDLNGDGYADFIVGSPRATVTGPGGSQLSQAGTVSFFYGGKTQINSGTSLFGKTTGDQFGASVSSGGDVNGDGYSDIIMGVPFDDSVALNAGKAVLFNGYSNFIDTTVAWQKTGTFNLNMYGVSVGDCGDLDGDGFSDVFINEKISNGEYKFSLFQGSPDGIEINPIFTLAGNNIGGVISKAGDVNGDGFGDFLVAANKKDASNQLVNEVAVFYGQADLDVHELKADTIFLNPNDRYAAFFAGDVNGDGYSDIIISRDSGNLVVFDTYFGKKAGISMKTASRITKPRSCCFSVLGGLAGDVNGDGFSDIFINEQGFTGASTNGKISVYYGSPHGPDTTAAWVKYGPLGSNFGSSVSTAGDINADGFSDLLIGDDQYSGNKFEEGKVDIFLGAPTGPSQVSFTSILGDSTSFGFGHSVKPISDVNGDGYSDFLVLSANPLPAILIGAVDLYLGNKAGVPQKSNWTIRDGLSRKYYTFCLSSIGDVNNDGFADFMIGDYLFSNASGEIGKAFAYYGGSSREHQSYSFQLLNPSSSRISAGNVIENTAKFIIAAPSYMGSNKARIVIETKPAGVPFSSTVTGITNSVQYSKLTGSITMSKTIAIQPLFTKTPGQENKIRIRFKFDPITSLCGQVYTPWRYNIYYLAGQNIHNYAPKYLKSLAVPIKVFLQGSYTSPNIMKTVLAQKNLIPATQPYGDLLYGPVFKYYGNETNANIPSNAVDWVLVELRNQVTDTSLYKKAGLLLNTGQIVDADGSSPFAMDSVPPGDYYIIIKHRNHLSIASAQSVSLPNDIVYDFTTGGSKAYSSGGASQIIFSDGLSGMIAGNSNINTNTRYIGISNDLNFLLNNTLGGNNLGLLNNVYNASDLNMDGVVRYTGISNDNGFLLNTILSGNRLLIYSIQFPQ
jgi:hypothetical protein